MKQLTKLTFSEQVYDLVRQRIRNGELRPGDRISEVALASACGISRAPVREALYLLETDGFVASDLKGGRCVTRLTPEHVLNRYELCGILESAAAYSSIMAMPESSWLKLEEVLEKMRLNSVMQEDSVEKAELSTIFHDIMMEYAANPMLAEFARKSGRVISKYLMFQEWKTLFTPLEMYKRHAWIYEALRTRNAGKIEKAVRAHYAEAGGRLAAVLQRADLSAAAKEAAQPSFPLKKPVSS